MCSSTTRITTQEGLNVVRNRVVWVEITGENDLFNNHSSFFVALSPQCGTM